MDHPGKGNIGLLFSRNIEPSCAYCRYGVSLGYDEVACSKRGIMSEEGKCGAFKYEPTKRKPEYMRPPITPEVSEDDFRIS